MVDYPGYVPAKAFRLRWYYNPDTVVIPPGERGTKMAVYLYEEDSGEEAEFEAADIVAAQAHGEALLRAGLDRQLAAIQRSGRKVDFPVEVAGHVTEQTGEYNSWADKNPGVPTVKFTAMAAGFPLGEEAGN